MLTKVFKIKSGLAAVLLLAVIGIAVITVVKGIDSVNRKSSAVFDGNAAYEYIVSLGPDVDIGQMVADEITVPENFGSVYENYNNIQRLQGFDLKKYKGCTLKRFTFPLTDAENTFAEVLTFRDEVVGADVYSTSATGSISPLK